ncbi:MAG: hypothetical protein GXP56_06920 [Deltaproteobacteria bacterium]|nr:hypothetical protein [Deltaproteobacteria bacterium]
MKLILFIHQDSSKNGANLENIMDQNFNGIEFSVFNTFNAFKFRLKQAPDYYENEIFILLADSKKRLDDLISLIDLLNDKRLILILPDESKATISKVHQFFPRFFTRITDTYDDLCSVLNKMINQK